MDTSESTATVGDEVNGEQTAAPRSRSKISFVYSDLEAAVGLSDKLRTNSGSAACTVKQLATWMNMSAAGGTFRSILGAARTFGLVETQHGGTVSLTNLGQSVSDEAERPNAIAVAFLNVPLHAALYEKYEGTALPPSPAIERHIETLGVPPKQKERARLTFTKSVHFAGFIDSSNERFMRPAAGPTVPAASASELPKGGGDGNGGGLNLDPLLVALLEKIPPVVEGWPKGKRVRWFRTFAMNVSQIYDTEDEAVDFVITVENDKSELQQVGATE